VDFCFAPNYQSKVNQWKNTNLINCYSWPKT